MSWALRVRLDQLEAPDEPLEVRDHFPEAEGRRDVLARRVEGSVPSPEEGDMPLVRVARDGVDGHLPAADLLRAARVAEAGHELPPVLAARDRRPARIAAEVHVEVPGPRLVPEEPDEVAPVPVDDGAVAVPLPADVGVQRAWHPARAVDGNPDAVR